MSPRSGDTVIRCTYTSLYEAMSVLLSVLLAFVKTPKNGQIYQGSLFSPKEGYKSRFRITHPVNHSCTLYKAGHIVGLCRPKRYPCTASAQCPCPSTFSLHCPYPLEGIIRASKSNSASRMHMIFPLIYFET